MINIIEKVNPVQNISGKNPGGILNNLVSCHY